MVSNSSLNSEKNGNLTKERQITKYRLLYSSREILESVAKRLLRIKEHAIANVFLYLCFQLRMIYVKIYIPLV